MKKIQILKLLNSILIIAAIALQIIAYAQGNTTNVGGVGIQNPSVPRLFITAAQIGLGIGGVIELANSVKDLKEGKAGGVIAGFGMIGVGATLDKIVQAFGIQLV